MSQIVATPLPSGENIAVFTFFDPRNRKQEVTDWHRRYHAAMNINVNYIEIDYRRINHGMEKGLEMLSMLSGDAPIVTDVHEPWQCKPVSEIVDVIQIPALLSRQTDLLKAAAETGKIVNVKKGQFMAHMDIVNVVDKLEYFGCEKIILTERGTTFGYNNLVVDMRSLKQMKKLSYPVMFDATHSVQTPGSKGSSSGGDVEYVEPLAMAAIAAGAGSLFVETHPDPSEAWCDGPNSVPLEDMDNLIKKAKSVFDLNLS